MGNKTGKCVTRFIEFTYGILATIKGAASVFQMALSALQGITEIFGNACGPLDCLSGALSLVSFIISFALADRSKEL